MISMKNVPKLKISEIEKRDSSDVWLLNMTAGESRSRLIITCPKLHGQGLDTLIVFKTFVAQNAADQVTKEQLLKSAQFRRAVTSGAIAVIDEDVAEQINSKRGAAEEIAKVQSMLLGSTNLIQSQDDADPIDGGEDKPFRPAIMNIINHVADSSSTELANTIRNLGDVDERELLRIQKEAKKAGKKELVKFCQKSIKELQEEA